MAQKETIERRCCIWASRPGEDFEGSGRFSRKWRARVEERSVAMLDG